MTGSESKFSSGGSANHHARGEGGTTWFNELTLGLASLGGVAATARDVAGALDKRRSCRE